MHTIKLRTNKRAEFLDITSQVEEKVREVAKGICLVFCPHTTAGLTINENADPDVQKDILAHLEKMVPEQGRFRHAEGNSDAHIKSSLLGFSLQIIIDQGKLVLGTWQGVYFCEFDGPRSRNVFIKIIADK